MQTFIINLKRRADRKEEMERQLKKAGIKEYKFIEAVDGSKVDFNDFHRYDKMIATKHNGEEMLPGEIACALSHINIYEQMERENINAALILEDDVVLPEKFVKILEYIDVENVSSDLITFNYPKISVLPRPLWRSYGKRPYLFLYYLLKIPYNLLLGIYELSLSILYNNHPKTAFLPRPLYLAGCYMLRKEGAVKLLTHTNPIRYTADKLINRARVLGPNRLIMKACVPLIVRQDQKQYGSDMNYESRHI